MTKFPDIILAFCFKNECIFVFKRDTKFYNRRKDKILTYVTSAMTSAFVFHQMGQE